MLFFGNNYNYWIKSDNTFDISRGANQRYTIQTSKYFLKFNPSRSALIINDMQNYFLSDQKHKTGKHQSLITHILTSIQHARRIGMQIVWINWRLSNDMLTISPSIVWSFLNGGIELEKNFPNQIGTKLEKNSWSAQVIDELKEHVQSTDLWIDKHRIGGFQGTKLQDVLASKGIHTLFFSGIHTDQSVLATLYDAHSFGYDCILLSDCTSTSSPDYTYDSAIYTVEKFGFVTDSVHFVKGQDSHNEISSWIEKNIWND
jgi:nicotinamidase-related amidase